MLDIHLENEAGVSFSQGDTVTISIPAHAKQSARESDDAAAVCGGKSRRCGMLCAVSGQVKLILARAIVIVDRAT